MESTNAHLKFSVLIIFNNESRTLPKTLACLKSQTYPRNYFEIITVDDGSTDDSANIVRQNGITTIIHTKHIGIAAARNIGIKHCHGDVIVFIDAHIYLKQNVLSSINGFLLKHSEYTGICGRYYALEHNDRNYIRDIRRQVVFFKENKTLSISLSHFTTFSIAVCAVYRNFFSSYSFPTGFQNSYGEDTFLQLQAQNNGHTFFYDPSIEGVHDAEIGYERLSKKFVLEIRSLGNILYSASLEKKEFYIPYLHYFLSYPLLLIITFILFIFNPTIFTIPLLIIFFVEIADALRCLFIKHYVFKSKLETFFYLIVKEIVSGMYTPYYLIFRKHIKITHFFYIFKQIICWEIQKVKDFVGKS
jgi:glycosyltransferase involved in cell wall biosynthesis